MVLADSVMRGMGGQEAWDRTMYLAFDFAVAHREQVNSKVDTTSQSRWYPYLAYTSLDPATIGKLKAYADRWIAASSRQATETTIANIQYRLMVRKERLPAIDAWLRRNG